MIRSIITNWIFIFMCSPHLLGSFVVAQGTDPVNHESTTVQLMTDPAGLIKASHNHAKVFNHSSEYWKHLVDSTWGLGLPLFGKLAVFDAFATSLSNQFDGFFSLGLNWDSLKTHYRSKIDSTMSRGRFASLMSRFAISLRDAHTWAWDTVVTLTYPSPGVPLLILYPFATAEHFGAVLTALPDSNALVLRTVHGHPLGLEPGDIVLGYEGVPWKQLVRELLDAELPVFSTGVGAASAEMNAMIRNVGNNWHLFDTIDIIKYSTHDTLHLPVAPLLTLPPDPMVGSEQLPIFGIPFVFYRGWPWIPTGQLLASGKLPSQDIGYIRLQGEWPSMAADVPFASAVNSFWNSQGIIIDMRWNSGGYSLFNQAFAKMFSQYLLTTEDVQREGPGTFNLVPMGNTTEFAIPGVIGNIFDRPIAVLLGPTCVSMGDLTAQRLRYHPMVRFFGKSSMASVGLSKNVTGFPGWWLRHSITDAYHISRSGAYLNRREFPVDESVWFTPDEVASGTDPVLQRAIEWINALSYAHDVRVSNDTLAKMSDSIAVTARVENPGGHILVVSTIITNSVGTQRDSLVLFDDGLHGDSASGDGIWGTYIRSPGIYGTYNISIRTDDQTAGSYRRLPDIASFLVLPNAIIETSPPGLTFMVDGTNYSTQQNYSWPVWSTHTISTTSPSGSGLTRWVFSNWSDGGAINHTITAPDSSTKYTAVFITQRKLTTTISPIGSGSVNTDPVSADGYYNSGTSIQLTAISDTGYTFTNWSGDLVGLINPQTLSMSTGRNVTANFSVSTNQIIATAGLHGTISPQDTVTMQWGASQRFIFTPNPGYYVDSVFVDNELVDSTIGYTFTNVTAPHTIRVVFASLTTVEWKVNDFWNLVSLPVEMVECKKENLFSSAISDAFGYESEYKSYDTLISGRGYWLKFSEPETYSFTGSNIVLDTVDVKTGWNLIGSISAPITVQSITCNSGTIITSNFFGYDRSYYITDTIYPGSGYWVKVNQDGKLILSSLQSIVNTQFIKIIHTTELPPPPPDGKENIMANEIPDAYLLEQNYPNPFNPVTTFTYGIPERSRVTLEIYNVLGQIVSTLVNNEQEPGYRSVDWIASNGIGSGLYFYRLTATSVIEPGRMFVQVRKMMVVK